MPPKRAPARSDLANRRRFLQFLAGSPLLYTAPQWPLVQRLWSEDVRAATVLDAVDELIASAADAINVFDFEPVARSRLSPAHWAFLDQGVDDDRTVQANRDGFRKFYVRPRRLVDVREIDMRTAVLGSALHAPIILAPTGGQGAIHAQGDVETAHGTRPTGHLLVVSTAASFPFDEIIAARGAPAWFQLYPTDTWRITRELLRRAEAAGCPVVALTVDIPARNQERIRRFDRTSPECQTCHLPGTRFGSRGLLRGADVPADVNPAFPGMTWDFVKRLRDATSMRIVIKGITTAEDASLCVEHGIDGLIVSNHGGRADESGIGTIELLPDVVTAVGGRIPVLIDGGFRRGTDIVKALGLGAAAICIGRPYLWGLAAFGREGVTRVLQILDRELTIAMQQAGTPSINALTLKSITSVK